jgi:hypothetical protein
MCKMGDTVRHTGVAEKLPGVNGLSRLHDQLGKVRVVELVAGGDEM